MALLWLFIAFNYEISNGKPLSFYILMKIHREPFKIFFIDYSRFISAFINLIYIS